MRGWMRPLDAMRLSESVVLPWSTCARMQMFRMRSCAAHVPALLSAASPAYNLHSSRAGACCPGAASLCSKSGDGSNSYIHRGTSACRQAVLHIRPSSPCGSAGQQAPGLSHGSSRLMAAGLLSATFTALNIRVSATTAILLRDKAGKLQRLAK